MCSFNCGDDSKISLKGISNSYSKNYKFDDYKKCLDGNDYRKECGKYKIRSLNDEMCLQKVKKFIHYLYLMVNDIMKVLLEINYGIIDIEWL